MKTKPWAILVVVVCTIFTALGSLFFKFSVMNFKFTIIGLITNYFLIIGLFFYFLGFVLLIWAFKHGELSVLFPIASLSFVWVAIFSFLFLSEQLNFFRIIGVLFIVAGVVVLGRATDTLGFSKRSKIRGKLKKKISLS